MRIHTALLIAGLAATSVVVGCGPNEIEMGGGGVGPTPTPTATATPTPTPTPGPTPNPALFAPVQAFMEDPAKANCAMNATCHLAPTGQAGLVWYTVPTTPAADVEKNRVTWSCSPNLETYNPVVSSIASQFCMNATTVLPAPQHEARTNLTNQDCVDLYAYLQSGVNPPAPCP